MILTPKELMKETNKEGIPVIVIVDEFERVISVINFTEHDLARQVYCEDHMWSRPCAKGKPWKKVWAELEARGMKSRDARVSVIYEEDK